MELVLVRHGRPERVDHDPAGADPGLNELGHRQAKAAAEFLKPEPIAAVYSSPQRRAQDTAAPIAAVFGLPVVTLDGLAEFDLGHTSYVPGEESGPLSAAEIQSLMDQISAPAFHERVHRSFDDIVAAHPGRNVAVVCHGGVISLFLSTILGTDPTRYYDSAYTSVTRVRASRSGRRSMASFNECHWLRDLD